MAWQRHSCPVPGSTAPVGWAWAPIEIGDLVEAGAGSGIDDCPGIQTVLAVQVGDVPRLTEAFDAQGHNAMPSHGAEPGQCRRVPIEHGHQRRTGRELGQQPLDV